MFSASTAVSMIWRPATMTASVRALISAGLMFVSLAQNIDTINATYGSTPTPFSIQVDPTFIYETQQKVASFRYTKDDLGLLPFSDGPPLSDAQWFRDAWVNSYNWTEIQAGLNSL